MRAYYLDGLPGDPRLPHDSGREVSLEMLADLKVQAKTLSLEHSGVDVSAVAAMHGFKNYDIVTLSKEVLGDVRDRFTRLILSQSVLEI